MILSDQALDQLFREARTHNGWQTKPVDDAVLKQLTELVLLGPTSANSSPGRFVYVKTPEGKEKLRPALSPANLEKTMAAPVTVIVGMDMAFYEHLPKLFPHADARSWFAGNDKAIADTAFRNSTLQGGYLILAAARSAWTRVQCRASTPPRSTRPSSPARPWVKLPDQSGLRRPVELFPRSRASPSTKPPRLSDSD